MSDPILSCRNLSRWYGDVVGLNDVTVDIPKGITGLLGPKSNAHGPNEFLEISTGKKLTSCIARILADHAARKG